MSIYRRHTLFPDLPSSGRALAVALERFAGDPSVVVLGIVRGGVPLAVEVAAALHVPLDLIVRRSLFQQSFEDCVGVVNVAGVEVLDPRIIEPADPVTGEEFFVVQTLGQFRARVLECRGRLPALDLRERTVIVVDNGIRSSLTMGTSVEAVRKLTPARVIIAVAVTDPRMRERVGSMADEFVSLAFPEPFGHVGLFFDRLDVPSEGEIRESLDDIGDFDRSHVNDGDPE